LGISPTCAAGGEYAVARVAPDEGVIGASIESNLEQLIPEMNILGHRSSRHPSSGISTKCYNWGKYRKLGEKRRNHYFLIEKLRNYFMSVTRLFFLYTILFV
jgi:hypothetical protein